MLRAMRYANALITGGSSGIGRSLAKRLAREGAEIVLCARRITELESVAEEVRGLGGKARTIVMDVRDTEATVASIRAIDDELGGLDLVIANAGIGTAIHGTRLNWERIRDACRVNFDGAIATLTAVLPNMVARNRGHLVGISSVGALAPFPTGNIYTASKAGLSIFLESLRLDLKSTGVEVTCVHPGAVKTPMTERLKRVPPMMMESDAAADLIVDRLANAPATIDFPTPLIAAIRGFAALPRALRDAALLRFPTPDEGEGQP